MLVNCNAAAKCGPRRYMDTIGHLAFVIDRSFVVDDARSSQPRSSPNHRHCKDLRPVTDIHIIGDESQRMDKRVELDPTLSQQTLQTQSVLAACSANGNQTGQSMVRLKPFGPIWKGTLAADQRNAKDD